MSYKQELELKIWKATMKDSPQHQNIHIPNVFCEIDSFIERNNLSLHKFKAGGGDWSILFKQIIDQYKPKTLIEIGSYVGFSACKFAEYNKLYTNDFAIICIDTWLATGWKENWDSRLNGQPTLFYSFIKNVKDQGHSDVIIPYQWPSINAFMYLKKANIVADVIYVDGAHDEINVHLDVGNYYSLLKPGGIMFGDDWTWDSVKSGVYSAMDSLNINKNKLHILGACWAIEK